MPIYKTMECDVLIVGGGAAGLGAAIKARDFAERVILVDKSQVGRSGASPFMSSYWLIRFPEDDAEMHMRGIIETGEYLSDQEWVKTYLERIYPVSMELEHWGEQYGIKLFKKDDKGNYIRWQSLAQMNIRNCLIQAIPMLDTLKRKAEEKGVVFVERTIVTDLATSGDKVVGAIGLNYRTGDVYLFKAKAVVAAAGMHHFAKRNLAAHSLNGEVISAAYRAGATIFKLEMACSLPYPKDYASVDLMLVALAPGARFVNKNGDEFMSYYLFEGKRARMQDLAIAFANEIREGRGPIYADLSQVSSEAKQLIKRILSPSDFVEAKVLWVAALAGGGGVRTNTCCESSLPGLYAAGDTSGAPVIGTYNVLGINISYAYLSGCIAGENAAQYAKHTRDAGWDRVNLGRQVDKAINNLVTPMDRSHGLRPGQVIHKIQEIMLPWPVAHIRNEQRLHSALTEIQQMREEKVPSMKAMDLHDLAKAQGAKSLAIIADLTLRAALFRQESRGFHHRVDYPYTDNTNWLKWIMIKEIDGSPKLWTEDVPTPYLRPSDTRVAPPGVKKAK